MKGLNKSFLKHPLLLKLLIFEVKVIGQTQVKGRLLSVVVPNARSPSWSFKLC